MIWLAKRVLVFCVLMGLGFFAAALLTALNAPPLVVVSSILVIPLVLTWPIASLWKGTPSILPVPASHVRSPVLTIVLSMIAVFGLMISVALLRVSVPAAMAIFFGTGIGIERILRASRPQEVR